MKIRNLIERLQEFDQEAHIYFVSDIDSKEGFVVGNLIPLANSLVMAILKKAEKPK